MYEKLVTISNTLCFSNSRLETVKLDPFQDTKVQRNTLFVILENTYKNQQSPTSNPEHQFISSVPGNAPPFEIEAPLPSPKLP